MRYAVALAVSLWGAPAAAAEVCVKNAYEVPWVHPGITFYLNRGEAACDGIELHLVKEGETRCIDEGGVGTGGDWHLAGRDASTGECVPICPVTRQTTRVVFSQSAGYACAD